MIRHSMGSMAKLARNPTLGDSFDANYDEYPMVNRLLILENYEDGYLHVAEYDTERGRWYDFNVEEQEIMDDVESGSLEYDKVDEMTVNHVKDHKLSVHPSAQ